MIRPTASYRPMTARLIGPVIIAMLLAACGSTIKRDSATPIDGANPAPAVTADASSATTDASTVTTDDSTVTTDSSTVTTDGSPVTTDGSVVIPTSVVPETAPRPAPGPPITAAAMPDLPTPSIDWDSTGEEVDHGTLEVPVDYFDPSQGTIKLAIARHNATGERIGSLFVNPGGPGSDGQWLAERATSNYAPGLVERFDIIGWDPRGTGESEPPINCVDDFDKYYVEPDPTPDDDADWDNTNKLANEYASECISRNPKTLTHVGTNNSARDIEMMRRALGEDQVSFFGFSYGSELGAVWATMFPDTVRAAVLDSATDPNAVGIESALYQFRGFGAQVERFLAGCDTDCEFAPDGNAKQAYVKLMDSIDDNPIPTDDPNRMLTLAEASTGVVMAMYYDFFWSDLESALADAQGGDGTGLLELADLYNDRSASGTYSNLQEAFIVISCMDGDERDSPEENKANAETLYSAAPLLYLEAMPADFACSYLPPGDPRIDITGAGAGPIIVLGATGDPATPYEGGKAMAKSLEGGVFVSVDANQHIAYQASKCIQDVVEKYLVDLDVPANEFDCGSS